MDNQTTTKSLPAIEDLFKQAWVTFKGTWVQLLVLYLVMVGIAVGIVIVLAIIAAILFGGAILSGGLTSANYMSLLTNPGIIAPLAILSILAVICLVIVSIVVGISTIKIVGSYPNKKTLGDVFHESFPLILPVLGVSILSHFLSIGGYMVFIIPGILFTFYFSFVSYEVILDNKRGLQALRSSLALVFINFWGIILRLFILIAIDIVINMILLSLVKGSAGTSSITNLISIPFGWFTAAYTLVLYKELKAKTGAKTEKSIGWIVGVSLIGWIFLVGLIYLIGLNKDKIMPKPQMNQPYVHGNVIPPSTRLTPYQNISTSSSYTY